LKGAVLTNIPFNRPVLSGKEVDYVLDAMNRMHVSGDGYYTKACHALLEQALQVPKALLTTSCTHALEMTALLLSLQSGDEVILPSFTFVSTANAYVLRGAKPIFIDIRPDTLNIDETRIERAISPRTRAIVVVHYAGVGCEMAEILRIAGKHGLPVIEDNAHGLFGRYRGRYLGTFGELATQSFHETKNFTCGEGGALLINNPAFIERAEILREKGTNRSRFFRGQVDRYTWVDVGSSYLPSDILAAFLFAQFQVRDQVQAHRQQAWERYAVALSAWAAENDIRMPYVPEHCEQTYHMFYLLLPSLEDRQALIAHLGAAGISSVFHYLPLHLSEMGRQFGGRPGDCPITEEISDRLLRLPLYNNITEAEQMRIVRAIERFRTRSRRQVQALAV
jgi:dTDP-4-amino-4,6-dideoxygalactose transaminase